jgi:hypothetical protein
MLRGNNGKYEQSFKRFLRDSGYSDNVASELWKWYDPSKKGVASF